MILIGLKTFLFAVDSVKELPSKAATLFFWKLCFNLKNLLWLPYHKAPRKACLRYSDTNDLHFWGLFFALTQRNLCRLVPITPSINSVDFDLTRVPGFFHLVSTLLINSNKQKSLFSTIRTWLIFPSSFRCWNVKNPYRKQN